MSQNIQEVSLFSRESQKSWIFVLVQRRSLKIVTELSPVSETCLNVAAGISKLSQER